MEGILLLIIVSTIIYIYRQKIWDFICNLYWKCLYGMATYVNHPRYTQVIDHLYQSLQTRDVKEMSESISEAFHLLSGTIKYRPIVCREDKDDNCPICLEGIKNGDKIVVLPCNHIGHFSCMERWLYDHTECPICKGDC